MEETILIPVEASLSNPGDPTEITLVADVSGVGITNRTSTGRIIRWTPEMLKRAASTLRGRPVNVLLSPDGDRATGHSRNVVGTIIDAKFDEATQKLRVFASLWRHYFPETVNKLVELFGEGVLQVSAEFSINEYEEEDGITTPQSGFFVGVGIVHKGADPQNRVLVLASALENDKEAMTKVPTKTPETVEILPFSYEWAGDQIANYLSNNAEGAVVTGTYGDSFFYQASDNTYQVNFTVSDDNNTLQFDTPTVWTSGGDINRYFWGTGTPQEQGDENMPTAEELAAANSDLEQARTEADEWKNKFETLEADITADREAREIEKRANDRMAEVEKIAPYKDETLKAEHLELFKTADEKIFAAVKNLILASVNPKGGISSESGVPTDDPSADPSLVEAKSKMEDWREEMLAQYPVKE